MHIVSIWRIEDHQCLLTNVHFFTCLVGCHMLCCYKNMLPCTICSHGNLHLKSAPLMHPGRHAGREGRRDKGKECVWEGGKKGGEKSSGWAGREGGRVRVGEHVGEWVLWDTMCRKWRQWELWRRRARARAGGEAMLHRKATIGNSKQPPRIKSHALPQVHKAPNN